ncbi:MAG: peptide-methionine (S)-S-oxide reductase MsrA [Flavobacteriales bacterium]|nr:peptide-methionine (S)-S-oxide reductase MsrA [Flavobacteriales bacterium]
MRTHFKRATLGGGCFWCLEAVYNRLEGVVSVQSGFAGGNIKNPAYREVCTGRTGHAEVCDIQYNPEVISFKDLLHIFWEIHDPTTLNRQGNDVGTHYRSVIYFHDEGQESMAEELKAKLDKTKFIDEPIITEITEFTNFYPAEDYHRDYYDLHNEEPYCRYVILPKVEKFKKLFTDKLKKG